MKILQISHSFYPCHDAGGVVKGVYSLSKQLIEKGHNVTVFTTDGCTRRVKLQKNSKVVVDGINVYYFRNLSNWLRIKLKIATPYYLPFAIRKEIKSFDIIHIHEHRTVLAIIVHYYAKKNGIPYIIQTHGDVLQSFQKQKLKLIFDYLWGYNILHDAKKAIALTKIESDQYEKMGVKRENIIIVPNAFDSTEYLNLPERGEFRKQLKIPSNFLMILFLGRLHKIKGIDLLIDSFFELNKEMENVVLVIIGPDDGYLKQMNEHIQTHGLSNRIIYLGPIYGPEKLKAYIDSDVYVLPSILDAFPFTIFEALACKIPVIVTTGCGIADIIKEKNIGCVIEYNKNQLINAMKLLLTNNGLRVKMGQKGNDFVMNNFDWKLILDHWEEVYHNARNEKFHNNSN